MKRKLTVKQEQKLKCQKLASDISNMKLFNKPIKRVKVERKTETSMQDVIRNDRNVGRTFSSAPLTAPIASRLPIRYEDEDMIERERIAQLEVDRKKKRVAIATNKGAYQYITDETDLTLIGKKI